MNHHTDQELVAKSLEGDTRAFSLLVTRYQGFVYTIIVRMVRVKEEAEEIAQDTFIKAYQALASFRGDSKFSSWLYRIAYRKALDAIRKQGKLKTVQLIDDVTEGAVLQLDNVLKTLELKERSQMIERSIAKLPEVEAGIITLFYFEEQSVREIAAITMLSEDNVKIKLYRSRKQLFTLLKHSLLPEFSETNGRAL